MFVSPIAAIVSSHGVDQQQYADNTQPFVFISLHLYLAVSAASSGVSLLFAAGSSTMVCMVLNQTKYEANCFGSSHNSNRFPI